MAMTNEQLIEELSNKPVMQIVELVKALEEKWGVSAASPVALAVAPAAGGAEAAPAAAAKTEFDVMLTGIGSNKVSVIKVVRAATNLGLKEAKDLVESAPAVVKEGIKKEEAEKIKKELEEAGATAELK